ncbi:MAG: sulfite exporter TauE/SafE family protein [Phycisphaerae bacterium]|nr:sulfite exporter TauE/SafE family protein [Phycisphaerae bacterium]
MTYIWLALVGGLVAFPHCVGMCGGFALHFGDPGRRWVSLGRQLGWHAGRLMTYTFLGGLAGFLGHRVSLLDWPAVARSAGYAAGAVTILMGFRILGLPPVWRPWRGRPRDAGVSPACLRSTGVPPVSRMGVSPMQSQPVDETLTPRPDHHGQDARGTHGRDARATNTPLLPSVLGQFLRRPTVASALAFGLVNGTLPCPVTLAFLAVSAQQASVGLGMAMMAAMGLGTMAALLPTGMAGLAARSTWRRHGSLLAGAGLILLGGWTILRIATAPTATTCCGS